MIFKFYIPGLCPEMLEEGYFDTQYNYLDDENHRARLR